MQLVEKIQRELYANEIKWLTDKKGKMPNLCKQLNLFLDSNGLLRCKGRLTFSNLEWKAKYPLLLPNKHHFSYILTAKIHKERFHSGVNDVVAALRQRWCG